MHDVLRQRVMRRLETLPEAQMYKVLDYIEFLESKYAKRDEVEPGLLQKFAEGVEDSLRKKAVNPATLREAFQLISAADKVLADVSSAGKQILDELGSLADPPPPKRRTAVGPGRPGSGDRSTSGTSGANASGGSRTGTSAPNRGDGAGSASGASPQPEVGFGDEWTVHDGSDEPGKGGD